MPVSPGQLLPPGVSLTLPLGLILGIVIVPMPYSSLVLRLGSGPYTTVVGSDRSEVPLVPGNQYNNRRALTDPHLFPILVTCLHTHLRQTLPLRTCAYMEAGGRPVIPVRGHCSVLACQVAMPVTRPRATPHASTP